MKYLQCRQQVLLSVSVIYRRRRDIEALSLLAVCSYMLSCSVLTPNAKLTECTKFIAENRCNFNVLCFLPGQFEFASGVLKFGGCLDKKYINLHFPKANYVDQGVTSLVISPIGNPALEQLASHFSSETRTRQELGTKFDGQLLYRLDPTTVKYANTAISLFNTYGLGAQGASRFFLLFWQEYMIYVRDRFVHRDYQCETLGEFSLGFECFGYGNNLKQFGDNIVKNPYKSKVSLEDRFARLLPAIELSDLGNVTSITKKICFEGGWNKFGSRGAYLKLALNPLVNITSLHAFRAFFLLAVKLNMEYIPYNSAKKLLLAAGTKPRFQRTIGYTVDGDEKPTFTDDCFLEDIAAINDGVPVVEESNKRRRVN